MTSDQLANKAIWMLAIAVLGGGVSKMDRLNESIVKLDEKMARVVDRVEVHDAELSAHENRLHEIEVRKHRHIEN